MRSGKSPAGGFTILELLIVMIIAILLMTMAVALFNVMMRGQGVRMAGQLLAQTMYSAQGEALNKRSNVILELTNETDGGKLRILIDKDGNKAPSTGDEEIEGGTAYLPKHVEFFQGFPAYIVFNPTGACSFPPGHTQVQRNQFDTNFNRANPNLMGDVIIWAPGKEHRFCLDIDAYAGKVRRMEYLWVE